MVLALYFPEVRCACRTMPISFVFIRVIVVPSSAVKVSATYPPLVLIPQPRRIRAAATTQPVERKPLQILMLTPPGVRNDRDQETAHNCTQGQYQPTGRLAKPE